tara:strand:+ start:56 stop:340 length:285 start_codon:yes stop_codon:yes gene_type:complete
MYKNIIFICFLFILPGCNKHATLTQIKPIKSSNIIYQEKPFELKWKIEKNSITNVPVEIRKKIKNVCKNYDRFVLIKIKTFKDDTALGTFDCRI